MNHETEQQRLERIINTAVQAGRKAHHTGNRTILSTNIGAQHHRGYLVLAKPDGSLTPAGRVYYEMTQEQAPDKLDYTNPPEQRGNSEYIKDRSGNTRLARTLQANGEYTYTPLGLHYFAHRRSEFVVHVPVICQVEDARYTRKDHYPYGNVQIEAIMEARRFNEQQRISRVKQYVLQQLSQRTVNGRPLIAEVSGEQWLYDRNGQWEISELRTEPGGDGPTTSALLRRPMGQLRSAGAFVTHAEAVLDEAWDMVDDRLCVVRQLSKLLGWTQEDLRDEFDRLLDREWDQEGLCPDDVKLLCLEHAFPYYCVGQGKLLDKWLPEEPKGRSIAFCTYSGHMYAYRTARVISEWNVTVVGKRLQLKSEVESKTVSMSEWSAPKLNPFATESHPTTPQECAHTLSLAQRL